MKMSNNYERIRSMTIEEMVKLIQDLMYEQCFCCIRKNIYCGDISCEKGIKEYLESESEVEG